MTGVSSDDFLKIRVPLGNQGDNTWESYWKIPNKTEKKFINVFFEATQPGLIIQNMIVQTDRVNFTLPFCFNVRIYNLLFDRDVYDLGVIVENEVTSLS